MAVKTLTAPRPVKDLSEYKCQSIDRAFAIMRALKQGGLGLLRLAAVTGIKPQTAHRLVKVLERHQVVEIDERKIWRLKARKVNP